MAVLLPRAGQADIAWFVDQPAPQPAVPAAPARVRLCNRMAGRWLLRVGGGPPGRGGKGGTFRAVTEEVRAEKRQSVVDIRFQILFYFYLLIGNIGTVGS